MVKEILGIFVAGTVINLINQRMVITEDAAISLENALLTYITLAIFLVVVSRLRNKSPKAESNNHVYYDEMNEGIGVHGALENLQKLSSQVHENASQVNKASTGRIEFAEQVVDLSQHIASSAEKIAESSQQSETILNDAANSHVLVTEKIDELNALLHNAASSVGDSMSLIGDFHDSFDKINGMADAITAISSQTNLLALNAAIEAARAGEQGRGFAVVADEVRTLASRTQKSTEEIEQMIASLQSNADNAVQVMLKNTELAGETVDFANSAGEALKEITLSIETIHQMNEQIATAAEEQTHVAEEINRSVVNINDIAQDTVADSNQTAQSSVKLSGLAVELKSLTARFKV